LAIILAIWHVRKDFNAPRQDTFFWAGAVPIAIFSMGQFGNYFGRGAATYQLSRSVSHQPDNQSALQGGNDIRATVKAGPN